MAKKVEPVVAKPVVKVIVRKADAAAREQVDLKNHPKFSKFKQGEK